MNLRNRIEAIETIRNVVDSSPLINLTLTNESGEKELQVFAMDNRKRVERGIPPRRYLVSTGAVKQT